MSSPSILRVHALQVISTLLVIVGAWLVTSMFQSHEDFYGLTVKNMNSTFTYVVATCLMLLTEMYSDYRKNVDQTRAYNTIEENGLYLAIYFSTRTFALAWLAGEIFK